MGVLQEVWEAIKNYFASLSPTNEATRNQLPLIQLRIEIITLAIEKQKLIDIVEAHINGGASGTAVSEDLSLSKIPEVLVQIDQISGELNRLAKVGNLFGVEDSFRTLRVSLDAKRAVTLCKLKKATEQPTPDLLLMKSLVRELKDELTAISGAGEALANYIKESKK